MEQPCLGLLHFFQTMLPHTRFRLAARAPPESTWSCTRGHLSRNATWLLAWSRLNRALFTSSSTSCFLTGASCWQHVLHWTRLSVATPDTEASRWRIRTRGACLSAGYELVSVHNLVAKGTIYDEFVRPQLQAGRSGPRRRAPAARPASPPFCVDSGAHRAWA